MGWKKALAVAPLSFMLLFGSGVGITQAEEVDKPSVNTPAVDLRADLGHLLSEHGFLAVETMRAGAADKENFDALANALNENTEELTDAITSVYGKEAGEAYHEMWASHIGYFVDYVEGTADDDEAVKQEALDNLSNYKNEFSEFLEGATDERLESDALAEGLQEHIGQLIGAFDSYLAGDYKDAYQKERQAINHMHMIAKGLSSAIAEQFADDFDHTMAETPAGDLRSDLGYLLSEHAGLAVAVMQNGIDGSSDFDASAEVLDENTEDLTDAIAGVYGDEAGQAFNEAWNSHIGYFVDYVNAAAEDDADAKEAALNNLEEYKMDFSSFMEEATEGEVPADDLAEGLQAHVDQLIGSFENYVEADFDGAVSKEREAYAHMYDAAELLSSGIVAQFPDKFAADMPNEMPTTGYAPVDNDNAMIFWIAGAVLLVLAAYTAIRRYKHTADNK